MPTNKSKSFSSDQECMLNTDIKIIFMVLQHHLTSQRTSARQNEGVSFPQSKLESCLTDRKCGTSLRYLHTDGIYSKTATHLTKLWVHLIHADYSDQEHAEKLKGDLFCKILKA